MPAERFYIKGELTGSLELQGPEYHHLARVMRIRVGEEIELVNGKGGLALARVVSLSKQGASLSVLSASQIESSPPFLILAIPLMRPSKLELILEKCTELGADAFWIYPADHSEKDDLSLRQQERLEGIAISSMKQCGRLDLPPIRFLNHLEEIFSFPASYLFGDLESAQKPEEVSGTRIFTTGPEKGFSKKEIALLRQKGKGIRLHKNILRAETAPIAAALLFS